MFFFSLLKTHWVLNSKTHLTVESHTRLMVTCKYITTFRFTLTTHMQNTHLIISLFSLFVFVFLNKMSPDVPKWDLIVKTWPRMSIWAILEQYNFYTFCLQEWGERPALHLKIISACQSLSMYGFADISLAGVSLEGGHVMECIQLYVYLKCKCPDTFGETVCIIVMWF